MQQATQAPNETRLPRAIQRQVERLNALAEPENPDPAVDAANPSADPAPVVPLAPGADPRESDPEYWRQRFKVTEGVLRSERARSKEVIDGLHQRVTELQGEIHALRASAPPAPVDLAAYFTPEQIEQFGEDQCRVMVGAAQKATRTEVQAQVDAVLKPLQEQQVRTAQQAEADRMTAFQDAITEVVPDWQVVDQDPAWHEWLAGEDDVSGLQRQTILDTHVQRRDAQKVARMFQAFKATKARPAPPVAPHGSGATPEAQPAQSLPTGGRPTAAETKDFYKRAALGKVSDKERAAFEARLSLQR